MPVLTAFGVLNPKVAPAVLHFDASSALTAELFYSVDEGDERALTGLTGGRVAGNRVELPAGASEVAWDFRSDLGGAAFVDSVELVVRAGNGAPIRGGNLLLGIGNDPPVVVVVEPMPTDPADPDESAGNVEVRIEVRDSSSDVVALEVEWRLAAGNPDAWMPATPAGVFPLGVETTPTGVALSFFWATEVDLQDGDEEVVVRVRPDDRTRDPDDVPVGLGLPLESLPFRVDNNEEPVVQLFTELLIASPDERRGIPMSFRVFDPEGERVELIFQWRREGQGFPLLPLGDRAALDALLADPEQRRRMQVCRSGALFAEGRAQPVDADTVRLPELGASASWIRSGGLSGATLELLRPSPSPSPVSATWGSNPLDGPVAALPTGTGTTVLVLESPPGTWRLREFDLTSGNPTQTALASGPGLASAMCHEHGDEAVLVASEVGGETRIERIEVPGGARTLLVRWDGADPGPVRGLVSRGTRALALTAGSSLLQVDYRDPQDVRVGRLLEGLDEPWGVACDPALPDRLFVSERGAGRILAVELATHGAQPVAVRSADPLLGGLDAPAGLAFEGGGPRLLVVTRRPGGTGLAGLELGAAGGHHLFPIGPAWSGELAGIATGPDGLRILSLPSADELLVGGGIEQRREILGEPANDQAVTVTESWNPPLRPSQPWRIRAEGTHILASERGASGRFLWDSTDVPAGSVHLRAIARDEEPGLPDEGAAPKSVRSGLDVPPIVLGGAGVTDGVRAVVAEDLDQDGDLDLACANTAGFSLTLFFQTESGAFELGATLAAPSNPYALAAADLDGDGDSDLVSANLQANNLSVFFQLAPGSYSVPPLLVGGPAVTRLPISVAAADLDGDRDVDLVAANSVGKNLTIFLQTSAGQFAAAPLVLGSPDVTPDPASVQAADFDGDGDVDLVAANRSPGSLTVFFQSGAGLFGLSPLVVGATATFSPASVAAADIDGDGAADLVAADTGGNAAVIFLQERPGAFALLPIVLGGFPTIRQPLSAALADLDGNGSVDVVTSEGSRDASVFFQRAPRVFDGVPLLLGSPTSFSTTVAPADLDRNGRMDLVVANPIANQLGLYRQGGAEDMDLSTSSLGAFGVTSAPTSLATGDFDGDGLLDLVSANSSSNDMTLFHQGSARSFGAEPTRIGSPLPSQVPVAVAAADLDGDADLDLLAGNPGASNLTLFFQLAPGVFGDDPVLLGGLGLTGGPVAVLAADLDGDGRNDVVSANSASDHLTAFHQADSGAFMAPIVLGGPGTTDDPRWVTAADLDQDGDLDLVSANIEGPDLTAFFHLRGRAFDPTPLAIPAGPSPGAVVAADLDQDGDVDLAGTNRFRGLSVFLQAGGGNYAPPILLGSLALTNGPVAITVGDMDGDDAPDLLCANLEGDDVSIFLQRAPGRFAAVPISVGRSAADGPRSVLTSDLDLDGDLDIAWPNLFGHDLGIAWGGR